MRIITKRGLLDRAAKYPDATVSVQRWFDTAIEADWQSLEEIRRSYPGTDMVGPLAIFNIHVNRYRLIVRVVWKHKRLYIKEFLTHAEYDKGRWKKWLN